MGWIVAPLRPDSNDLNTVVTLCSSFSVNMSGWLVLDKNIVKLTIQLSVQLKVTKLKKTSFNKTFLVANYGPPIIAHTDISVDGPLLPARLQLFLHVGGHGLGHNMTGVTDWGVNDPFLNI